MSTIVALAALWTLFEWGRLFLICGYPWNPVGLSLTGFLWPLQAASLFGILGFTFIVMCANLLLTTGRKVLSLIVVVLPFLWGAYYITEPCAGTVRIALVQPNIPPLTVQSCAVWDKVLPLLRPLKDVSLIVLPEGLLPYGLDYNRHILQDISNHYKADVIAGVDVGPYQAAVFITPGCEQFYGKRMLVPIGEYIPFDWCVDVARRFGIVSSYQRGEEAKVFSGKNRAGIGICYDEVFSHIVRDNYALGPEFLVFISNDGWYPHSTLPKQHFFHARLRAVELGLSMVRACTTGITTALDGHGRILAELPENEAGVLTVDLPLCHLPAPYALWGDGPVLLLCFFCLGIKMIYLLSSKGKWRIPHFGVSKKH